MLLDAGGKIQSKPPAAEETREMSKQKRNFSISLGEGGLNVCGCV